MRAYFVLVQIVKKAQKQNIALCVRFLVHTRAYFADIAYFARNFGRFKGDIHTDEQSKLNNRGRLGEPIPKN